MRHVVITGGASGLGRAMAERFIAEGDNVTICEADPHAVAAFGHALRGQLASVASPQATRISGQVVALDGHTETHEP